ncbi:MAG: 3-isopropylmalate dehydratase small subunit [Anaerolineaceae bacterium]|nr:3-isopropylmalate dehydratase small subunit [Anaerolineaceae bacterium]
MTEKYTKFTSKVMPLPINDIDTDQIIPARFLKVIDKEGIGKNLFFDWRYLPDGSPNPEFIINDPKYNDAAILLAGDNFGCGSSREHAPWALVDHGFKVVISSSFADIFYNNALKNSLLPIKVDPETHEMLFHLLEEVPNAQISIDLEEQVVHLPTGDSVDFPLDPFAKHCLLEGVDQLGYLINLQDKTAEYEKVNGK